MRGTTAASSHIASEVWKRETVPRCENLDLASLLLPQLKINLYWQIVEEPLSVCLSVKEMVACTGSS